MRITISLVFILVFYTFHLAAQDIPADLPTPEQQFDLMRSLASKSDYAGAKSVGNMLMVQHPEYLDAAIYMARIYGWDASYDSAYQIIDQVLSLDSSLIEAHKVRVDIAYWENDWAKLEQYASKALEFEPDSPELKEKYQLAKSRQGMGQSSTEIFVHYFFDHFKKPYTRNWHMVTAGGNIPFKMGILSPYLNGGYAAGTSSPSTDLQINLDAYLNLGKKNYALAGYGISPDGIVNYLPTHRAAAEIWHVFPKGFTLSAGIRYFYWSQHYTFLTFSEEKYAGKYLFSFRSYLFFKDYGVSGSYYLSARRYFEDKFNFVTLTLGYGTAPDEPLLVVSDLDRLKALSARFEYSKQIRQNLRLNVMTGYAYEAYTENENRHRIDLRTGLYIRLSK